MMQLGEKGKVLIQSFEKLALIAYRDQGGVWTIGWGHVGPEAFEGATCTREQADAWFEHDVQTAVVAVIRSTDTTLTQNEFDALVAFTFNVGGNNEAHSTLVRMLNANNRLGAAAEFLKWDHVGKKISAGLDRRRAAERELFLTA